MEVGTDSPGGLVIPTYVTRRPFLFVSMCESGFLVTLKAFLSIHLYIKVLSDTLTPQPFLCHYRVNGVTSYSTFPILFD